MNGLINGIKEIEALLFKGNTKPIIVQLAKSADHEPMFIVRGDKSYPVSPDALYDAMSEKRKTFSDAVYLNRLGGMYVFTLKHMEQEVINA